MSDFLEMKAGEFTTRIRFFSSSEGFLDDASMTVFDTNTSVLFPNFSGTKHVWPAGEGFKTWPQIDTLLKASLDAGLARDSTIMGIGGGVVTDMAAFAASLYMRGCRLILAPTTLLAMVDAAVGGKTGVDYEGYKNLVGTFYPAHELRIYPALLKSLPDRDFKSGLAEVIKHALLGEPDLLKLLQNRRQDILAREDSVLEEVVRRALLVKVGVVQRDLREDGERAFLNLGHTFGHALESVMGFDGTWTHGEAVSWGISRALDLGVGLGETDPEYSLAVNDLLTAYGFRLLGAHADPPRVLSAMKKDKKKKGGIVRFVLQRKFGETFQRSVEDADVLRVLERG